MAVGYTTLMYDASDLETGVGDAAACRYDGLEVGLGKVRAVGPGTLAGWLEEHGLALFCVMSDWLESAEAAERVADEVEVVADLGAEFLGLLPPQRGRHDGETVAGWLETVAAATEGTDVTPVLHHHGGTAVERPDEIRRFLDAHPDLGLLFDTAHYYPYGANYPEGDVTDGVERFADDVAYVHLKDVAPGSSFDADRDALTAGRPHLDNVVNYFRAFTDLGEGVLDFAAVHEALAAAGYDGHYTIEVENRTADRLVHAKRNLDYWRAVTDDGG